MARSVFDSLALHHNVSRPDAVTGDDMRAAFEASAPTADQSRLVRHALMEMAPCQLVEVRRDGALAVTAVARIAAGCLPEGDELLELLGEFERLEMAGPVR